MKKILGLAAGLLLTAATFAQSDVKFNDANDSYNKATTQTFHFTLDSKYSEADVTKSAEYYTSYFSVAYAAGAVTITLVEDTEMNRRIIQRFFVTLGVSEVDVNGTNLVLANFVDTYILP